MSLSCNTRHRYQRTLHNAFDKHNPLCKLASPEPWLGNFHMRILKDEDWPRHANGERKTFAELCAADRQAAMNAMADKVVRDLLLIQEKLLTAACGMSVNH